MANFGRAAFLACLVVLVALVDGGGGGMQQLTTETLPLVPVTSAAPKAAPGEHCNTAVDCQTGVVCDVDKLCAFGLAKDCSTSPENCRYNTRCNATNICERVNCAVDGCDLGTCIGGRCWTEPGDYCDGFLQCNFINTPNLGCMIGTCFVPTPPAAEGVMQGLHCGYLPTMCGLPLGEKGSTCGDEKLCVPMDDMETTTEASSTGRFGDCRRDRLGCDDGDCNLEGTSCVCDDGYTEVHSFFCVNDTSMESACTNDQCQNGGQCVVDSDDQFGSGEVCVCLPDFVGTYCERPRFETICNERGMLLLFRPDPDFVGTAFINGKEANTSCVLRYLDSSPWDKRNSSTDEVFDGSSPGEYALYYKNIPLNSCGMTRVVKADGSVEFTTDVMISYTNPDESLPVLIMYTDQIIRAQCTFPPNATLSQEIQVQVNFTGGGGSVSDGNYAEAITISMEYAFGGSLVSSSVIPVGTPFDIVIRVRDTNIFQELRVESVFVSPRALDTFTDEYPILQYVSAGCPDVASPFYTGPITTSYNNVTEITTFVIQTRGAMFTAGSADGQNQLHHTIYMRLCSVAGNCQQPTAAECEVNKRKKRSVIGSGSNSTNLPDAVLTASLTVTFGESPYDGTNKKSSSDITEECMQKPHLQNIIIILCVLIFVFILACVIFICLIVAHNRRRRSERGEKLQ